MKPDYPPLFTATIIGHCHSLKNGRMVYPVTSKKTGQTFYKLVNKPAVKKYLRDAMIQLNQQLGLPRYKADMLIEIWIYYAGPMPDALGPGETVFDALEDAGIVVNDSQLIPIGIHRKHVKRAEERATVTLWEVKGQPEQEEMVL